ncbi:MAG: hypothetical protein B7Z26_08245 [Asticcacaulis sp. 32-58-5]|nr:MAG: hypothetical protein B7Z26_08245 [Asticcacaulis sp. 32-58-5]
MGKLVEVTRNALTQEESSVRNIQQRNNLSDALNALKQHEAALLKGYPMALLEIFAEGPANAKVRPADASGMDFGELSLMDDSEVQDQVELARAQQLAAHATIPVINGLTDKSHPCQIIADLQTIEEHRGPVKGKTLAWIGDGNNVCASFIHAAPKLGFSLNIACPPQYGPSEADLAHGAGANITVTHDPKLAVSGADAVMADTWVSMGDTDYEERMKALGPYQVNEALMALAKPDALFLHCLPAHRGEEVTEGVIDGPQSVIWDEAENRIHAQKAVLNWCFKS